MKIIDFQMGTSDYKNWISDLKTLQKKSDSFRHRIFGIILSIII